MEIIKIEAMEAKIIKVNHQDFIVHFKNDGSADSRMRWSGSVTQIQMFSDGTWNYQSNQSSDSVEKLKDARVWFKWSFCWRGVWEGRMYFNDDQYWCEEMETIPLIWKQIEVIVKDRIKYDNHDYVYFDD